MRILLVEDEPKLAEAVKKGLEMKGFSVDYSDNYAHCSK
jgi:DNA-binding response OmpR family regulator